jgi:hypothetical protein
LEQIINNSEYGNIPDDILEIELGEFYNTDSGFARYSLRNELDTLDEEILHAEWDTEQLAEETYPRLLTFVAWTENNIAILIDNPFDEKNLVVVPRNPTNAHSRS